MAKKEGDTIKGHNGKTLKECQAICDETKDPRKCNSFGWCPEYQDGTCYLREKSFEGTEELAEGRKDCFTYYRKCTGKLGRSDL